MTVMSHPGRSRAQRLPADRNHFVAQNGRNRQLTSTPGCLHGRIRRRSTLLTASPSCNRAIAPPVYPITPHVTSHIAEAPLQCVKPLAAYKTKSGPRGQSHTTPWKHLAVHNLLLSGDQTAHNKSGIRGPELQWWYKPSRARQVRTKRRAGTLGAAHRPARRSRWSRTQHLRPPRTLVRSVQ